MATVAPMPAVPTARGRSADTFNDYLRSLPEYRSVLQAMGVNLTGPLKLTSAQRARAEQWVRQQFPTLSGRFQIDPAGNVNTDHGLSTAWSNPYFRTALIAGGALATAGLVNPGLLGFGSATAPTAGGATTSSALIPNYGSLFPGAVSGGGAATTLAPALAGGGGARAGLFAAGSLGRDLVHGGLQYGLPTIGGLINTRMQNNAAREAADIMADYYDRALEVEKEKEQYGRGQRADYLGRLQPFGDAGRGALGDMQGLLAGSSYQPFAGGVQPGGGGSVSMVAPDGSTKQVPAHLEAYYSSKGARRA